MSRELGKTQKDVLRAMREHGGSWAAGCGWLWDTHSNTARIMRSLARRGLVEQVGHYGSYGSYVITDAGRKA